MPITKDYFIFCPQAGNEFGIYQAAFNTLVWNSGPQPLWHQGPVVRRLSSEELHLLARLLTSCCRGGLRAERGGGTGAGLGGEAQANFTGAQFLTGHGPDQYQSMAWGLGTPDLED